MNGLNGVAEFLMDGFRIFAEVAGLLIVNLNFLSNSKVRNPNYILS